MPKGALEEPPRSLVPLEVSQKSLRGLRATLEVSQRSDTILGGFLEAPGKSSAPQKSLGRAWCLNMLF